MNVDIQRTACLKQQELLNRMYIPEIKALLSLQFTISSLIAFYYCHMLLDEMNVFLIQVKSETSHSQPQTFFF